MEYQNLFQDFERSPSLRLLKTPHAPFIITFLHRLFKNPPVPTVPLTDIQLELEGELAAHAAYQLPSYRLPEQPSHDYLHDWAQHRFIDIILPLDSTADYVQLTPDTERVIGWLEDLHAQPFIGTESRLLSLVRDLRDLEMRATGDPQRRLLQLEAQRQAIDEEIQAIRESGRTEALHPRQVQERFYLLLTQAHELLRDFRQVEQHIEQAGKDIQQAQIQKTATKGAILQSWLDADDALKQTPQGASFTAFFSYLSTSSHYQELNRLLDEARKISASVRGTERATELWSLPHLLLQESTKVTETMQRVIMHVKRAIVEQEERRAIHDLITTIKYTAQTAARLHPTGPLITVEGTPKAHLPLERSLWHPPYRNITALQPQVTEIAFPFAEYLQVLLQAPGVNKQDLLHAIARILKRQPQATLEELLLEHPAEHGFEELVQYCLIAHHDPNHELHIHDTITVIASSNGMTVPYTLPVIIFKRAVDTTEAA